MALLCVGTAAWAKPVHIRWKEMKGAVQYELQISKDGAVISKQIIDEPKWQGDLAYGVYSYSIRAYDRVRRPGAWSQARALVVMPSAPEPKLPEDGAKISFYTSSTKTKFKWDSVPGATRYFVEVRRDETVVYSNAVHGTEVEVPDLKEGKYHWQVAAIFDAAGRAPASLHGRRWEGKFSESSEFKLRHDALEAPKIRDPEGVIAPPKNRQLVMRWSPVDGAVGYEVIVLRKVSLDRAPAGEVASRWVVTGKDNTQLTVAVPRDGDYSWQVRAIASLTENHLDDVGEKSSADFTIDRNADYADGSGYLAVSTMIAPYTYKVNSNDTGYVPLQTSSAATAIRLSGEYWIAPQSGVSAQLDDRFYSLAGSSFDDKDLAAAWKFRTNLDASATPWVLQPEFGYEFRQYSYIVPAVSGSGISQHQQLSTTGPAIGFDLRKQFSRKFSLGAKIHYYLPMTLSGVSNNASLSLAHGSETNRNLSVGLQSLYWMQRQWGLGFGVFIDDRSIAATSTGGQGGYVQMDGTYFFGSLVWRFGQ